VSPAGTRLRQTLVTALAPGSLLRLAAPLVLSFWMRAAVTLVDTIYASFVGDAAVAAVGLTIPFEFLMIAAWVGLSTGLTACLARILSEVPPRGEPGRPRKSSAPSPGRLA